MSHQGQFLRHGVLAVLLLTLCACRTPGPQGVKLLTAPAPGSKPVVVSKTLTAPEQARLLEVIADFAGLTVARTGLLFEEVSALAAMETWPAAATWGGDALAGYRTAGAPPTSGTERGLNLLQAGDELSLTALAEEVIAYDRTFSSGSRIVRFAGKGNGRALMVGPAGKLVQASVSSLAGTSASEIVDTRKRLGFWRDQLVYEAHFTMRSDPKGQPKGLDVFKHRATERQSGWSVEYADVSLDLSKGNYSYTLRAPELGLEETGTSQVTVGTFDSIFKSFDPLLLTAGAVVVKRKDGSEAFRKRTDASGAWCEFPDNVKIQLSRAVAGATLFSGEIFQENARVGSFQMDPGRPVSGDELGFTVTLGNASFAAVKQDNRVKFLDAAPPALGTSASEALDLKKLPAGTTDGPQWSFWTLLNVPGAQLSSFVWTSPDTLLLLDNAGPTLLGFDLARGSIVWSAGSAKPSYPCGKFLQVEPATPLGVRLKDAKRLVVNPTGEGIWVADSAGISEIALDWGAPEGGGPRVPQNVNLSRRVIGTLTPGYEDGAALEARFRLPIAAVKLADNSLVFLDFLNHALRRLTPDGQVNVFAGTPGQPGDALGQGTKAGFNLPLALSKLPGGDLVVADSGNYRLCRVSSDGNVSLLAGDKTKPAMDAPVPAFAAISSMDADREGRVYLGEYFSPISSVVRRVDSSGKKSVTLGGGWALSVEDGPNEWAGLGAIQSLRLSEAGHLLFLEANRLRIAAPTADL